MTSQAIVINGSTITINHSYTAEYFALSGSHSNDPIQVAIVLSHPSVIFEVNGQTPPLVNNLDVINKTLATFFLTGSGGRLPPLDIQNILALPVELVPQQVTLTATPTLVLPLLNDLVLPFTPLAEGQGGGATQSLLGIPYLKTLQPDGSVSGEATQLSFDNFRNLLSSDPDTRAAAYANLSLRDGHYQIVLKPEEGSTTERTVLDVYIRQGQPIDFADFEEDAGEAGGTPGQGAGGAGGDQTRLAPANNSETRPGGAADVSLLENDSESFAGRLEPVLLADQIAPVLLDPVLLTGRLQTQLAAPRLESSNEQERETADERSSLRTISQVPLIGAAIACEGLRRRWEQQTEVDRRQATSRPLTKAGRLYARLRRQAAQSLKTDSE
jgi:hypothetical protein